MDRYELLLFLHIAASIVWLGAGFLLALQILGARQARDRATEVRIGRELEWLTPRLFIPASLATVLLGIVLVIDSDAWSFDQLWIVIGLVGWTISFVLGFFYFSPEGERVARIADERELEDAELDRRLLRLVAVDRAQVLILFLVVADMVIKPTGDDEGVLIVGGALVAIAALLAAVRGRARPAAEPAR